jgi:uncharacterized protein YpmB
MQNHGSRDPGTRRKGRAAITVVAIILAVIVVIFVGRNLWYANETSNAHESSEAATGGAS